MKFSTGHNLVRSVSFSIHSTDIKKMLPTGSLPSLLTLITAINVFSAMPFTITFKNNILTLFNGKMHIYLIKAADKNTLPDPSVFDYPEQLACINDTLSLYCLVFSKKSGIQTIEFEADGDRLTMVPASIYKMPNSPRAVPLCINSEKPGKIHLLDKKNKEIALIDLHPFSSIIYSLHPYLMLNQRQIDWDLFTKNSMIMNINK